MPRYKIEGRLVKLEDLSRIELHALWRKYNWIREKTPIPEQWVRAVIAMNEIEQEIVNYSKRTTPRWPERISKMSNDLLLKLRRPL